MDMVAQLPAEKPIQAGGRHPAFVLFPVLSPTFGPSEYRKPGPETRSGGGRPTKAPPGAPSWRGHRAHSFAGPGPGPRKPPADTRGAPAPDRPRPRQEKGEATARPSPRLRTAKGPKPLFSHFPTPRPASALNPHSARGARPGFPISLFPFPALAPCGRPALKVTPIGGPRGGSGRRHRPACTPARPLFSRRGPERHRPRRGLTRPHRRLGRCSGGRRARAALRAPRALRAGAHRQGSVHSRRGGCSTPDPAPHSPPAPAPAPAPAAAAAAASVRPSDASSHRDGRGGPLPAVSGNPTRSRHHARRASRALARPDGHAHACALATRNGPERVSERLKEAVLLSSGTAASGDPPGGPALRGPSGMGTGAVGPRRRDGAGGTLARSPPGTA
nr:translation initiation factor IF-2-like [Chlorocebus sabaeus]